MGRRHRHRHKADRHGAVGMDSVSRHPQFPAVGTAPRGSPVSAVSEA